MAESESNTRLAVWLRLVLVIIAVAVTGFILLGCESEVVREANREYSDTVTPPEIEAMRVIVANLRSMYREQFMEVAGVLVVLAQTRKEEIDRMAPAEAEKAMLEYEWLLMALDSAVVIKNQRGW